MNEPQQLPLLKTPPPKSNRLVEYAPPTPEQIDRYVQAVCKSLTKKGDGNYCDTDFVRGLTVFTNVVVNIQTHYLNQGVKDVQ